MPRMEVKITVKADGKRVGKEVVKRKVTEGLGAGFLTAATHAAVDKLASDLRAEAAV